MFGVAIWDVRQERLVVARDPFGIKLIYYRIDKDRLYFGSEIRAVQAVIDESPNVDPNALNLFLRYRYTPSPHTMFKGIRKLAAGTMLVCEKGTSSSAAVVQLSASAIFADEVGRGSTRGAARTI